MLGQQASTNMVDFHRGFAQVDQSADEQSFVQFLEIADQLPSIVKCRERMLELCPVAEKSIVLDVGCGIGTETARIASRVGKYGKVHGVDSSKAMILGARSRTKNLNLSLDFDVCDAQALPFEDSSFHLCRAEKVLLYVDDPAQAISEMARITRPGGQVIVFDFDYGACFVDSDHVAITRQIEELLRSDPRQPTIGRELPHLMRRANLRIETIEPITLTTTVAIARRVYAKAVAKGVTAGLFAASDADAWWREQEAMDQEGRLYHAHHGYIVAASKF
jgi:ubiquinone/menaquinone biosynthesis C-methylase UbiE